MKGVVPKGDELIMMQREIGQLWISSPETFGQCRLYTDKQPSA
jgi:hypothetical protein